MNRHRIIAAVTAAFGQIVDSAATQAVANATVLYERPDTSGVEPKVYIYMYQATPNAAARNLELPTRYQDGAARQRPLLALDLHYLLTFVGDDKKLDPQKMLGNVTSTIHAYPVLWPDDIRGAAANPMDGPLIEEGDDEVPIVNVRFAPVGLNLEELSKVWSVFFQTPYSLSVVYRASMVLVEHDLAFRSPLPAQRARGESGILSNPILAQVISEEGPYRPITADGEIRILGTRLRGEQTLVRFVESGVDVEPNDATDSRITASVPTEAQTVAVQTVRVVQRPWDAAPGDSENEVASNPGSFVLYPKVVGASLTGTILAVDVSPAIGQAQKTEVLLDQLDADDPATHQLTREAFVGDTATTVSFELAGAAASSPGTYAIRIRVDGVASLIELDPDTDDVVHTVVLP